MNNLGRIFDIQRSSFVDGPGIRTTVFFKGCNLKCKWCHNPESQKFEKQILFYADKCTHCGMCKQVCKYALKQCDLCGECELYCAQEARKVCGKDYTVYELMQEIFKDKAFYEASGGGVTFSGGECMLQIDFLEEILKKCKEEGISTAVDTAGHVPFERFERISPYTDLFLYDIKCFDSIKHKAYTGVGNELIFENLAKLQQRNAKVWIRIPVIKGVNDSVEKMTGIRRLLEKNGGVEKVELLPYHNFGENKRKALGNEATENFQAPTKEEMRELEKIFE